MTQYMVLQVTLPTKELAQRLGSLVVGAKLACSVHVEGPHTSTYLWKGEIHSREEWVCKFRTHQSLCCRIGELIREHHPYEVPEFLGFPIIYMPDDVARWFKENITVLQ